MAIRNVIVGLGNPESERANTRHNAGFHVMHALAAEAVFRYEDALNALVAIVDLNGIEIAVICPQTGMNSSGVAVKAALEHYCLTPASLLIVYDDVSMPLGRVRFQHNGGAGGHHGIESTFAALAGSREFDRLKMAVGPDPGGAERYKFVLAQIDADLKPLYNKVVDTAAEAVKMWVTDGVQKSMMKYNGLNVTL